jgi:hypothetical protein
MCCYNDDRNKFYKKCHFANCQYCVEKYNIKTRIIKQTNNDILLDYPPKKRKQNNVK